MVDSKKINVLILTGKFGLGHISVAKALKEDIENETENVNVNIVDLADYVLFPSAKLAYSGFNFFAKNGQNLYNKVADITDTYDDVPFKKIINFRIKSLIQKYNPSIIVTTFPACGKYISYYKEKNGGNFDLVTYVTDIDFHREWKGKLVDYYFVGSEMTKNQMIRKGVDEKKIIVSGIPLKSSFKNIKGSSSINPKVKNVLIMGGGLGLLPEIHFLLESLKDKEDVNVTLITGKNKKMFHDMKQKYPQISVIGFTDLVAEYMCSSDLIISKPGGVTMFEAISCTTPLFITTPFLYQEVGNAKYVEIENIGKVVWDEDNIDRDIKRLLEDDTALEQMKHNMEKIKKSYKKVSIIDIYKEISTC